METKELKPRVARTRGKIREKDGIRGLVPDATHGILDEVFNDYLATLDPLGNARVKRALALAPEPKFREFLRRIAMNWGNARSLAAVAKGCGIDLIEFENFMRKAATHRAMAVMQTASVEVAEGVAQFARPQSSVCERCEGLTWIGAPAGLPPETPGYREIGEGESARWIRDCPFCAGGRVERPGDQFSVERVLSASGLMDKKPIVQINQSFGGAGHEAGMQELAKMTIDVSPRE